MIAEIPRNPPPRPHHVRVARRMRLKAGLRHPDDRQTPQAPSTPTDPTNAILLSTKARRHPHTVSGSRLKVSATCYGDWLSSRASRAVGRPTLSPSALFSRITAINPGHSPALSPGLECLRLFMRVAMNQTANRAKGKITKMPNYKKF